MFALVDCNSCFASCEQIYRPDLRNKPVIVLSNNDGCIIARSKEAKLIGIPDLDPYFKWQGFLKKHHVTVFSANFRLYGDVSWRVMETLRQFSPDIEIYSIDEMFLSLKNVQINDLSQYGEHIKDTVWQEIKMPVAVGIAPTKTLAKLANHAAKKIKTNNIAVLDTPQKWQWLQAKLPVNKVWGIGSRLSKRLAAHHIHTILDLANAHPKMIRKITNINVEKTILELNGISCIPLEEHPPAKKEIFVTRSFGEKTTSLTHLENHISRYASAAAEKLRLQNHLSSLITVFVHTSSFNKHYYAKSISVQLPYPTNDTPTIIQHARYAMQHIYKPGYLYAKCGIGLLDLRDRRFHQHDLFTQGQSSKSNKAMRIIDMINQRYGRDTIVFSSEGIQGKWTMNQHFLSPSYTTKWTDIPNVVC